MTHRTRNTTILSALLLLAALLPVRAAREESTDQWRVRRQLVERLGAQGYKINRLTAEMGHITDVIRDVRDVQIFPAQVTRISDANLVRIDKQLERLEKKHRLLNTELQGLRVPLSDAMGIVREMVAGEPVAQMFVVIERGDLDRLNQMLVLRRHIQGLWLDADTLLSTVVSAAAMSLPPQIPRQVLDNQEFFEILRANLGLQYQDFYEQLNQFKDSLVARATPAQAKQMLKNEMKRVYETLSRGQASTQLRESLLALRRRYDTRTASTEIDLALTRVDFMNGRYPLVIERAAQLPAGAAFDAARLQYTAQSLYQMGDYKRLHELGKNADFSQMRGTVRNLLLWLTIESGLQNPDTTDYTRLVARVDKDSTYAIHVLYAFAQTYVARQDWSNALSVLEGALRIRPRLPIDQAARDRARLGRAQIHYETGRYDRARELFFELLNERQGAFEEALFGIIWTYIAQGDYPKAELSLKKLVNQSPQNPLAVESILTMAKRQLASAAFEWEKCQYYQSERKRLAQLKQRLEKQAASRDTSANQSLGKALADVRRLLAQIENDPAPDEKQIRSRYTQATRTCELVQSYYASGTFREQALSGEREKLLYQLDSLVITVAGTTSKAAGPAFTRQRQDIEQTKKLVERASIMRTRSLLDRYRWEREHLDWRKTLVKATQDSLRALNDPEKPDSALLKADAHLNARLDSLVNASDQLASIWFERLSRECYGHLTRPLPEEDEVFVRYQLGELLYGFENQTFVDAFSRYELDIAHYENQLTQFRSGTLIQMPQEPAPPRLDHKKSMEQFSKALEKYPRNPLAPALMYSLAWCYSDLNRADTAAVLMEQLAQTWPDHEYAPQAWMYLGEYLFDNNDLASAVASYQKVMQYPESKWFEDALYKFAWSQYRLSNPEKAISSFLALVDLGGRGDAGKAILEKESMDYIAISFSESDLTGEKGLDRATKFVKRFGDEEKGTQILSELARVYKDQGRYDMSKQTYRTLLKMYPDYRRNWLIESRLLALLERDMSPQQHIDLKMEFFTTYNKESLWALAQADTLMRNQADSASSEMLYDVGISYHQGALQNNRPDLYEKAAGAYEQFIRHYPLSPRANECHYNFAEIKFSLGDYARAAEEYMAVSRRYPDSKYRETAAWNAIVASQNLLKQELGASN